MTFKYGMVVQCIDSICMLNVTQVNNMVLLFFYAIVHLFLCLCLFYFILFLFG